MHRKEFLDRVQAASGIPEREKAEKATVAALNTLRTRISREEADDVAAQLPADLREMWGSDIKAILGTGGRNRIDEPEFVQKVALESDINEVQAKQSVRAVFHTLKQQITAGEAEDVAAQLPKKLKILWLES